MRAPALGQIPGLVLDLLDAWAGEWRTIDAIESYVVRHYPPANRHALQRFLWRAVSEGRLDKRLVPAAGRNYEVAEFRRPFGALEAEEAAWESRSTARGMSSSRARVKVATG